jgi:hypothetical protein
MKSKYSKINDNSMTNKKATSYPEMAFLLFIFFKLLMCKDFINYTIRAANSSGSIIIC